MDVLDRFLACPTLNVELLRSLKEHKVLREERPKIRQVWAHLTLLNHDPLVEKTSGVAKLLQSVIRIYDGHLPAEHQITLALDEMAPDHNGASLCQLWQAVVEKRCFVTTPSQIRADALDARYYHHSAMLHHLLDRPTWTLFQADTGHVIGLPDAVVPEHIGLRRKHLTQVALHTIHRCAPDCLQLGKLFTAYPPRVQWVVCGHGGPGVKCGIQSDKLAQLLTLLEAAGGSTLFKLDSCFIGGEFAKTLASRAFRTPILFEGLDENITLIGQIPSSSPGLRVVASLPISQQVVKVWSRLYLSPERSIENSVQFVNNGELICGEGQLAVTTLGDTRTIKGPITLRVRESIVANTLEIEGRVKLLPTQKTTYFERVVVRDCQYSNEVFFKTVVFSLFFTPEVLPRGRMIQFGSVQTKVEMRSVWVDLERLMGGYTVAGTPSFFKFDSAKRWKKQIRPFENGGTTIVSPRVRAFPSLPPLSEPMSELMGLLRLRQMQAVHEKLSSRKASEWQKEGCDLSVWFKLAGMGEPLAWKIIPSPIPTGHEYAVAPFIQEARATGRHDLIARLIQQGVSPTE